jgi:uncharacterized protein YecE (DUF72 family)
VSTGGQGPVRIGCSGWNYPHWRNGVSYPPRLAASRWLAYYAQFFETVEVHATFYRLPQRSSVQRFYACIEPLVGSPKLGPILWQLPPNVKRDDRRLAGALERLPRGERHCFEFREPS